MSAPEPVPSSEPGTSTASNVVDLRGWALGRGRPFPRPARSDTDPAEQAGAGLALARQLLAHHRGEPTTVTLLRRPHA